MAVMKKKDMRVKLACATTDLSWHEEFSLCAYCLDLLHSITYSRNSRCNWEAICLESNEVQN